MQCNATVPVSAIDLKLHEMKSHGKWYELQYQKGSDLPRRQKIIADFKDKVKFILKSLKLEILIHIDNVAREYVYCPALECCALIVNKYCHKGNQIRAINITQNTLRDLERGIHQNT